MKKVIIDQSFWEIFPKATIHCLVVRGINNEVKPEKDNYFAELLADGKKEAQQFLTNDTFSANPVIQEWREAFKRFKTKKGARSSIEALLKRANQDRTFNPINPLVDIYNSISLRYGMPLGGEDLDAIIGDLHLGLAKGGESFFPLGAEEDAPALAEELIYYDNQGAICRCLNWREAQRTMLKEATTDAILFIESINEEQNLRAEAAMKELKKLVEGYFQVEGTAYVMSRENSEVEI
jgi:DNA/RNA-binding domain of Phe-tRNA-synthetase-like protein